LKEPDSLKEDEISKMLEEAIEVDTIPVERADRPIVISSHVELVKLRKDLNQLGGCLLLRHKETLFLVWNDKVFVFEYASKM